MRTLLLIRLGMGRRIILRGLRMGDRLILILSTGVGLRLTGWLTFRLIGMLLGRLFFFLTVCRRL